MCFWVGDSSPPCSVTIYPGNQCHLGWLACVCLLVGFALKQLFVGKLSQWLRAGLAATTHTVWSMILFWVVLASVSQHGGRLGRLLLSPHWRALGKLTNCVLLVHPLVTRWMLLSLDHSVHVSDSLLVSLRDLWIKPKSTRVT